MSSDHDLELHEIRFVQIDELEKLQKFISIYWKKDHIFTRNTILLNWQHLDNINKRYNFITAFNKKTKLFDAILGFISPSQFDIEIPIRDIWLAIWKVSDEKLYPGLGFKLYQFLIMQLRPRSIGILGISEHAYKIYQALKFKTGTLSHLYIPNKQIKKYSIAAINSHNHILKESNSFIQFNEWDQKFFPGMDIYPQKTLNYFVNRYLKHPIYKYKIIEIFDNNKPIALFVYRKIFIDDRSCLRIVDWVGNLPNNIKIEFQRLLELETAEYIDMLCNTEIENKIREMGFLQKDINMEIIPNYFEPYEQKNVTILYAYKASVEYRIFKGDSDQDRPNL